MGKNIRMTALLLAVSLLLNMVVLPVRAEGTTASTVQTTTESDDTVQETDLLTDKQQPSGEEENAESPVDEEENANSSAEEEEKTDNSGDAVPEAPAEKTEEELLLEEEDEAEQEDELLLTEASPYAVMALTEGEDTSTDYISLESAFTAENLEKDSGGNITKININSGNDLILLSNVNPADYQNLTLNIVSNQNGYDTRGTVSYPTTSGETSEESTPTEPTTRNLTFQGLGTESYPFQGTISIAEGSAGYRIILNRPLFNGLSDKAVVGATDLRLMLEYIQPEGTEVMGSAVLADTVVHDGGIGVGTGWYLNLVAPSESAATPPLINTLGSSAIVNLAVTNKESTTQYVPVAKIVGKNHAGFLCALMGANSSLTLTELILAEGSTLPTVEAKGGDAGALVGTMASGASLIVTQQTVTNEQEESTIVPLRISKVTATGSAGGIVGSATDADIPEISLENASATISGAYAGGLIGSYTYSGATGLSTVSQSISGITVNGSSNAGGVFGVLNNTSDNATFTINSPSVSTTALSGSNAGGLIGQYQATKLEASLILNAGTVTSSLSGGVTNYGGLVGEIKDNPAYIEIGTPTVTATGEAKNYGGLVGSLSNAGHMLKVGTVTTSACKGSDTAGGLVGYMPSGVLWLSETVNTEVNQYSNSANRGWILGYRDNTLVYSTIEWTPKGNGYNDIGNWGQVVQVTGDLAGLVTPDATNHTVTVCAANGSYTIGDATPERDFAAIALRFQLEHQENGALKITSDISDNDLKGDSEKVITLNADVDLSGTGLTGFQRDYSTATVAKNVTLTGNNCSITFPDITVYCGSSHNRQGLFAKTNGLTVTNVTLQGGKRDDNTTYGITVSTYDNNTYAGALVAESSGAVSLTNVKSYVNIEVTSSKSGEMISGLVAYQDDNDPNKTVIFNNCQWNSDLTYEGSGDCYLGGFLARTNNPVQIEVTGCTIGGSITKTGGKNYCGGLVASLIDANGNVLTIDGLTVDGVTIDSTSCTYTGGLLGWEWMNARVQISGVVVKNSTLNAGTKPFGGLVYKGSGYWTVSKKTTDGVGNGFGIKFVAPEAETTDATANRFSGKTSSGETSGLIVGRGDKLPPTHWNALYLEIHEGSYTIESGSVNLTIKEGENTSNYFDEIVGVTISREGSGNGIVSIATDSDPDNSDKKLIHRGTGDNKTCNTYENQLSKDYINPNTRYYYNLDSFGAGNNPPNDALIDSEGDMVLFSAYTHCDSGLQKYFFASKPGKITGKLDLTGYSYYPAEQGIYADIDNADIKFDYEGIESREQGNKPLSDQNRQHKGMHTGIFGKVENGKTSGDEKLTVDGLTLRGTVGGFGSNYGALIRDNAQGSNLTAKMVLEIKNVTLEGIRVCAPENVVLKPLLINRIGSFTTLDLSGVTAMLSSYSGVTAAASSLIGNVGSDSGTGINLTFSNMALEGEDHTDGKTYNGPDGLIFTRALFLESFRYSDSNCSGVYNFEKDAARYTVGQELSNTDDVAPSGRNNGNQYWFHNSYFTNDDLVCGEAGKEATYYANYKRYVHWGEQKDAGGSPDEKSHEIDVNVRTSGLLEGCGTYSHPYVITNGNQLKELAEALDAGGLKSGWKINLYLNALNENFSYNDVDDNACVLCKGTNNGWVRTDNNEKIADNAAVLKYLRNAYYVIRGDAKKEIKLPSSWAGLGGATPDKAFSGVIVGETDAKVIITPGENVTRYGGLIKFSQGSVVKNLTIEYSSVPKVSASEIPSDTSNATFFGGVVGWCLGGDTIIDNVTVTGLTTTPATTGTYPYLAAVGGYVGIVGGAIMTTTESKETYGGGVVFRGNTFLQPNIGTDENSTSFYVNPYVGRVLDGYAISEDQNLDNTNKNYKIPNFKPDASYLEYNSDSKELLVNNAEGLWLLSAIANSGSASVADSNNWAYCKGKTRTAGYGNVGKAPAEGDLADETYLGGNVRDGNASAPYLVAKFAPGMQNLTSAVTIELSGTDTTFDMTSFGNGFRGIGASYGTNADDKSNYRLLQVTALNGNGNTVTLAQDRKEYTQEKDNWTSIGSGLFVLLRVPSNGNFSASNLTLKGSTGITYYSGVNLSTNDNIKDGNTIIGSLETGRRLSLVGAGMLAGNLAKEGIISEFSLNNISVTGENVGNMATVNGGTAVGSTQAGGLIGALWNGGTITNVSLTDCVLDNVSVKGRMNVGGFLGYVSAGTVSINYSQVKTLSNISTTSTQVTARSDDNIGTCGVGGLIGFNKSRLTINAKIPDGLTAPPRLTLENLGVTNSINTDPADKSHAGGLVGLWVQPGGTAEMRNITMVGKIEIIGGGNSKPNTSTGGLVGALVTGLWNNWTDGKNCGLELKGVQLASGQDSSGNNSSMVVKNGRQIGGLFGMTVLKNTVTIDDVIIGGDNCPVWITNTVGMSGQAVAALIAVALDAQKTYISNTRIINTNVLVRGDGDRGAGLVTGFVQKNNAKIDLRNLTLRNSAVATDNDNLRTGLLYGRLDGSHTIVGANILVQDCISGLILTNDGGNSFKLDTATDLTKFQPKKEKVGIKLDSYMPYKQMAGSADEVTKYNSNGRKGIFGGDSGSGTVKLVGVSIQQSANTLPMKDFGTDPSSGSYVIRADYTGAAKGDVARVIDRPVSLLPIAGKTITGDGADFMRDTDGNILNAAGSILTGNDKPQSIANQIWTDSKGPKNLNLKYYSQIQESLGFLKSLEEDKKDTVQFTDFNTAAESNIAANFPVIALQSSNSTEINNSIFSCISLLSNWEECSKDSSGNTTATANGKNYYKLTLTAYKWDENSQKFVVNTTEKDQSLTLKKDDKIYLNPGKYDNQKGQFTLIDVAYYDPAVASPNENTAVAYHLYIPVVVKKMFQFQFWAAAKMGTSYTVGAYGTDTNPLTAAAIGTHGEPVTVLLNYEYQWTQQEWQTAIDNGQNLLWNFQHGIQLDGGELPSGTKLTLVDRNNADKVFYKQLTEPSRDISFSDFADFADENGTTWDEDHKFLCDELNLLPTQANDGTYYQFGKDEDYTTATLRDANGNYYCLANDSHPKERRYNIEVSLKDGKKVSEQYYLTIQTLDNSQGIVNVTIQCPDRLKNPQNGGLPSRREDVTNNNKYTRYGSENKVILGNFFTQELTVTTSRVDERITAGDASIPVTLHSKIAFKNDEMRYLYNQYARGQRLYQCFELKMREYGGDAFTNHNIVQGTEILVQFYRGGTEEANKVGGQYRYYVDSEAASYKLKFPGEGIPASELGNGLDLYADVQLNYTAAAIQSQFPTRETIDAKNGIAVAASSNLAYTEASLEHTTNRTADVEATHEGASMHFYRDNTEAATLHYVAYEDYGGAPQEGVSELGINGLDGDSFSINTAAQYDISALPNAANAKFLQCTVALSRQASSSTYDDLVYEPVQVGDHLSRLYVSARYKQGDTMSESAKQNALSAQTLTFPLDSFDTSVPIQIPVDLTVLTGSAFEAKYLTYANYRVTLSVVLQDEDGKTIEGSSASDYIVYTNAKIYPYLVK